MEDYAHILDFLPQGLPGDRNYKREPVAYGIGESEFKLFEMIPVPGAIIGIGDKVYLGKDMLLRTQIQHVKRRVGYEELTAAAQAEMPYVVMDIVKANEQRFVRFFNEAHAVTTKFHMLELLPGLGKKTMWAIIEEKKKGDFKDFADIAERVTSVKHPEKLIAKRVELELSNPNEKYHVFVSK